MCATNCDYHGFINGCQVTGNFYDSLAAECFIVNHDFTEALEERFWKKSGLDLANCNIENSLQVGCYCKIHVLSFANCSVNSISILCLIF